MDSSLESQVELTDTSKKMEEIQTVVASQGDTVNREVNLASDLEQILISPAKSSSSSISSSTNKFIAPQQIDFDIVEEIKQVTQQQQRILSEIESIDKKIKQRKYIQKAKPRAEPAQPKPRKNQQEHPKSGRS